MHIKKIKFKTCGFLLSCLSIILLFFMNCDRDSKEEKGQFKKIHRVLEHLSEKNVLHTPFKDIIEKFRFVVENITHWQYVPGISDQQHNTWAFSTSYPVLGDGAAAPGDQISLMDKGERIQYLTVNAKAESSWKWIKTSEELDLGNREHFQYNKKWKGIVIETGHPFSFEKLFPTGEVILYITVDSATAFPGEGKGNRPVLSVNFNDNYTKNFRFNPKKRKIFKIHKKTTAGLYRIVIRLKYSPAPEPTGEQAAIVLKKVKIMSDSDTIIYTAKPGSGKKPPSGDFKLRYYTCGSLRQGEDQAMLPQTTYLYQLKSSFPVEYPSVKSNPYSIIKKIPLGEYTVNAVAAPPRTEFTNRLRIPRRCKLEFAYGFLNEGEMDHPPHEKITFHVRLKSSGKEVVLFKENKKPVNETVFCSKTIDLSRFANQDVELSFITDREKPGKLKSYRNVPLWINPILYVPADKDDVNIILISLDTVRPDYLGCYGCPEDTSPAIDRFSKDAVLFLNAYSTTSWTLPAHISLLTSLNCPHHRVYYPYDKMDAGTRTLAEILRENDFFTAAVTGGGFLSAGYGFAKGFDLYRELKTQKDEAIRSDEAEYLARQSLDLIEQNKDKRFFLFFHTYQVHDPYGNPSTLGKTFLPRNPEWEQVSLVDLFKDTGRFGHNFSEQERENIAALYKGEIRYTDDVYVNPILARLKKLNIYDKTMIILLSDHGEEFYEHEAFLHDHSLYEEAIRIPLLIKFPYSANKGRRIKSIVRITDVLPTILSEVGVTSPAAIDGKNLLPLCKGGVDKGGAFFCDLAIRGQKGAKIITVNRDNFKFILNETVNSPYVKKVVKDFSGFKIELYDLDKDPQETFNLTGQARYHKMCVDLVKKIRSLYRDTYPESIEKNKVHMDRGLLEKLKALGYIE